MSAGNSCSWKLDFLSPLCQSVVNPHLKHGKALLQFLRSCPSPIAGRKFGFDSAVDFERKTRSRKLTNGHTIYSFASV